MQRKKTSLFNITVISIITFICITLGISLINIILNRPLYIDKEVTGIFNSFKKDAIKHKVNPNYGNLTITFTELPIDIAGRCNPLANTIEINSLTWQYRNSSIKKALLYHELAHCTLFRDHSHEEINVVYLTCPMSIMYPSIDPLYLCYQLLEDWYIKELFTNPFKQPLIGE